MPKKEHFVIQLPALIDATLAFFMAVHRFSAQRASSRCLILMADVCNDAGNGHFQDIVKSCHIGAGIAACQRVVSDVLTLLLREFRQATAGSGVTNSPKPRMSSTYKKVFREWSKA